MEKYSEGLRVHWFPAFENVRVGEITPGQVKTIVSEKVRT
jgi:hypothetical protein